MKISSCMLYILPQTQNKEIRPEMDISPSISKSDRFMTASSFSSSPSKLHRQRRKIFPSSSSRSSSPSFQSPFVKSNHSTTAVLNHTCQNRRFSSSSNPNNSASRRISTADRRSIFNFDSKNLSPNSFSMQESSCASTCSISSNDSAHHDRRKESHGKVSVTKHPSLSMTLMSNNNNIKKQMKVNPPFKRLPKTSPSSNESNSLLPSPSSSESRTTSTTSKGSSSGHSNQNDTSQKATVKSNNAAEMITILTEQRHQQQQSSLESEGNHNSENNDSHISKKEQIDLTTSTVQEKNTKEKIPPQLQSSRSKSKATSKSNISNNTLERRLFHALHSSQVKNPSIKEFKECWAFSKAVQTCFSKDNIEIVLDVAGGHGALGALLLLSLPTTIKSIIIDPAKVNGGVELAWGKFYSTTVKRKELTYRHECLRSGLRKELDHALNVLGVSPKRILVVACHACQHLSDETLEIACEHGVHVTVMPCCQKDLTGGSFKAFGKQLSMNIGVVMDILAAGKVMSWNNGKKSRVKYQVKMKLIDDKITPQNRIILCKAKDLDDDDLEQEKIKIAHERLTRAYHKAHGNTKNSFIQVYEKLKTATCIKSLSVGLVTGVVLSYVLRKR